MISLEKNEVAKYLRDYAIMSELVRNNPDRTINSIFNAFMIGSNRLEDCNSDYFIRMIRVYALMCELRMFSFREDLSIDFLKENELDISDIKDKIFVNKDDSKYFSSKQIIKYIRNAFNHSDQDKRLYNISFNGRFIEINLQNTKPIPFHVKLNYDQLHKINYEIAKNSHSLLLSMMDWDAIDFSKLFLKDEIEKLKFIHYYFPKKVDFDTINSMNDFDYSKCKTVSEMLKCTSDILNSSSIPFSIETFPLKKEQIAKSHEILSNLSNKKLNSFDLDILKKFLSSILSDIIPLGMYHVDQLGFEEMFAIWFMYDSKLSYNQIVSILNDVLSGKEYRPNSNFQGDYSLFDKERYESVQRQFESNNLTISVRGIQMSMDYNTRKKYPIVLYLEYIASCFTNEEMFDFSNIDVDSEHIRNAFVHGRWFFGEGDNIELYDCQSGNNNDYNFNWHKTMNIRELLSLMDSISKKDKLHRNK